MQIKKATREQVKLKLGVFGPSGSGKTTAALNLAYGVCGDWSKICIIDTENGSASLYSDMGAFDTLQIEPPFSPEKYLEAIKMVYEAGVYEVIIIDSISHEWSGKGGILEIKDTMTGNDFAKRGELTKRHNKFRDGILHTPIHIIITGRTKEEYQLVQGDKGMKVEKMGTGIIQRDGVEYELTTAFSIDIKHNATTSKDRTKLFMDQPAFLITTDTGKKFVERAKSGVAVDPLQKQKDAIRKQVSEATDKDSEATIIADKVNGSDKLSSKEKDELIEFIKSLVS